MNKILNNTVYKDSTLKRMTKSQLIDQIRVLEHNWQASLDTQKIQLENFKQLESNKWHYTSNNDFPLVCHEKVRVAIQTAKTIVYGESYYDKQNGWTIVSLETGDVTVLHEPVVAWHSFPTYEPRTEV